MERLFYYCILVGNDVAPHTNTSLFFFFNTNEMWGTKWSSPAEQMERHCRHRCQGVRQPAAARSPAGSYMLIARNGNQIKQGRVEWEESHKKRPLLLQRSTKQRHCLLLMSCKDWKTPPAEDDRDVLLRHGCCPVVPTPPMNQPYFFVASSGSKR